MAQDTPRSRGSAPLFLDDYVQLLLKLSEGDLPEDPTTRRLLQDAAIARAELTILESGAPEVIYSGFPWEPERVDSSLSDDCVVALALGAILRTRHQLHYWEPMLEMGLSGRFRGHLGSLVESRDMLRAISRLLVDRPLLTRRAGGLQRRLAHTLNDVIRWLPPPVEDDEGVSTAEDEIDDDEDTDELPQPGTTPRATGEDGPGAPPPPVAPARAAPHPTAATEMTAPPYRVSRLLVAEIALGVVLAAALVLAILFKMLL